MPVFGKRKNAGIRKILVRNGWKKFRTFLHLQGILNLANHDKSAKHKRNVASEGQVGLGISKISKVNQIPVNNTTKMELLMCNKLTNCYTDFMQLQC